MRDPLREVPHGEAVVAEPGHVVGRLPLTLGMPEAGGDELPAVDDAGVGREHQVGQPGHRRHELDLRAHGLQHRDQAVPLAPGLVGVHPHLAVHPGVDLVEDLEVLGRAHQEAPAPGERL